MHCVDAKQDAKCNSNDTSIQVISGVLSVKGAELHYIIEGDGYPCLVLGHSKSCRLILSQELRNHFRFVFLDLRNDAASNNTLDASKITLDTFLDDINTARKTLGFDKHAILGHSIFSIIALEYGRKYPHYTTHIVISGYMPYIKSNRAAEKFWESDASDERKMILKQNFEQDDNEIQEESPHNKMVKLYRKMAPKLWYNPKYDPTWIYDVVETNRDVSPHSFLRGYDIAKRPGTISTPVFLAIGRYDYLCPYFLWDDRKYALPDLSYNLFMKSGHFPMVEEKEQFDRRLIEWFNSKLNQSLNPKGLVTE
jgi:proline iminopeptidase